MTINHKKFYNIEPRRLVHFTTLLRNIRLGCMATTDALAYYQKSLNSTKKVFASTDIEVGWYLKSVCSKIGAKTFAQTTYFLLTSFHSLVTLSPTWKRPWKPKFWKHFQLNMIILNLLHDSLSMIIPYHNCIIKPLIGFAKYALDSAIKCNWNWNLLLLLYFKNNSYINEIGPHRCKIIRSNYK